MRSKWFTVGLALALVGLLSGVLSAQDSLTLTAGLQPANTVLAGTILEEIGPATVDGVVLSIEGERSLKPNLSLFGGYSVGRLTSAGAVGAKYVLSSKGEVPTWGLQLVLGGSFRYGHLFGYAVGAFAEYPVNKNTAFRGTAEYVTSPRSTFGPPEWWVTWSMASQWGFSGELRSQVSDSAFLLGRAVFVSGKTHGLVGVGTTF